MFNYFFPDTSQITKDSLWLAKKTFYKDEYSVYDLFRVDKITHSGVFTSRIYHENDWSHKMTGMNIMEGFYIPLKTLMRKCNKISIDKAKEIGYAVEDRLEILECSICKKEIEEGTCDRDWETPP